ncbi:MAG: M24 family metallopeptidase [Planctomycetota bacterium]
MLQCLLAAAALAPAPQASAPTFPYAVLPHRERHEVVNDILRERLDELLPGLMRETGIDMWVVANREYAEDPVYLTLVPEPVFAARRTTLLVLFDRGVDEGTGEDLGVERLTVSRYDLGEFYASAWPEGGSDDAQWARLAEVIAERDPKRIGVNTSRHWAAADGLSHGLRTRLEESLPGELRARLVPAESLCIRWIETRTEAELALYPQLVGIARSVIAEAFSNRVITPGATTTDDVAAYLRQRFEDLGLDIWFHPYCNVQREGLAQEGAIQGAAGQVIQRGDLVHTDVGIHYLRLCTDTQEMAYVLREGEDEVPAGIAAAMDLGNHWQDLLTGSFELGRAGNDVLAATRDRAAAEDIECSVYTHPLGFFGHAAGPTIGMWDNQGPTPIRGDWPLHANTCYAIEGNVTVGIPEWGGQRVQIKLEQDAVFDGECVRFLGGRQTCFHEIR